MSRRLVLLVTALLVTLLGVGGVYAYASKADQRAAGNQTLTPVLVAKSLIKAGTSAKDAAPLTQTRRIAAGSIPEGALVDLGGVTGKAVSTDVYPGEVLLGAMFASPEAVAASGADALLAVPPGLAAMSVELVDKQRVARFVQPGDFVAVYATRKDSAVTRLLFPHVQVLAVGPVSTKGIQAAPKVTSGAKADTTVASSVLTLAVDLVQGGLLAHASEAGDLTFALETLKTNIGVPQAPVSGSDVYGGVSK